MKKFEEKRKKRHKQREDRKESLARSEAQESSNWTRHDRELKVRKILLSTLALDPLKLVCMANDMVPNMCEENVDIVLAMIVEKQRLRHPFFFVIARPDTDSVHVAPVFLWLGVHAWVSVDLARGRLKDRCP